MATLISPRGYRVTVADGKAEGLLRVGYAYPEPPKPAVVKRKPGRPRKSPTK
jgi:hypothetical protein